MGEALVIRDCGAADIAAVTAIYAHAVEQGTGTFEITPPDAAEIARRLDDVRARGLPYVVADDGSTVLGFAYAAPFKLRDAYNYTVESSVYVDDGCRRSGVGRTLMEEVISRCAAAGKRQMVAIIGDSANAASIALHGAIGFHRAGCFEKIGFKHGRWLDTVLMQRDLGEGANGPPG